MRRDYFLKFVIVFLFQLLIYSTATPKDISIRKQNEKKIEVSEYQTLLSIKYSLFGKDINPNFSVLSYINRNQNEEISTKSPWLAFGLSYLFPGLGQLYNGEYLKAFLFPTFFCIGAGLVVFSSPGADFEGQEPGPILYAGMVLAGGSYLWSLIDAPISANRINEERTRQKGMKIISVKNGKYVLSIRNGRYPINFNLDFSIYY